MPGVGQRSPSGTPSKRRARRRFESLPPPAYMAEVAEWIKNTEKVAAHKIGRVNLEDFYL